MASGKLNRFPVESNAWVVDHLADVASENPLLLNPCGTNPEDLFGWEFQLPLSTVIARNNDIRAERTIDILGGDGSSPACNQSWMPRMTQPPSCI
ncbi:hypothetical protein [Erythrobacter donghaensis]|uniref:hypothetical protein n=1 Tax=Erythrobacter donghaensis TaxID=267135 RepID=UPI00117F1CD9|nr:hypothetical protein [Erythrobacter donghaensis]